MITRWERLRRPLTQRATGAMTTGMPGLDEACAQAGKSMPEACAEAGYDPEQIRQLAQWGQAPLVVSSRLAAVLGADPAKIRGWK